MSKQFPDLSPGEMAVTRGWIGDALIVTVHGEIDLITAPDLCSAVITALHDAGTKPCILDLTEVGFLGSAGLSALVKTASTAEHREQPLGIVVDSNRPVIRPLQVTGLDEVLALFHTVDEALAVTAATPEKP
ncbi:MAG: STAS domain-containing protein [Labedaea sp.]